jgi:hypothetical protein
VLATTLLYCRALAGSIAVLPASAAVKQSEHNYYPCRVILLKRKFAGVEFRQRESHLHASRAGNELKKETKGPSKRLLKK